jgi:NAD(P)-dependent dehydrogenase (short-subunit alcohol dehydrogenase family)
MAQSKTEPFRLDGKVALITGAATGLGAGIAIMLARQGANVAISDKPGVSLEQTAQRARGFGHLVFPFELDVRDAAQWTLKAQPFATSWAPSISW